MAKVTAEAQHAYARILGQSSLKNDRSLIRTAIIHKNRFPGNAEESLAEALKNQRYRFSFV